MMEHLMTQRYQTTALSSILQHHKTAVGGTIYPLVAGETSVLTNVACAVGTLFVKFPGKMLSVTGSPATAR